MLQNLLIKKFTTNSGKIFDIPLSYQTFGQELHSARVVMINHALTGNSEVAGEKGWWKDVVGENKTIDTNKFTIICFNVPGNGFDNFFIENPEAFTTKDIARIFLVGLQLLQISQLDYLIGGSIGGSIGWEMLCLNPEITKAFVPIATDYKTSDWLHSQCLVQKFLLESADKPLEKARIHAMLCYRTPESLNFRFKNEIDADKKVRKSHDWLNYHGKALSKRFSLKAYRLMNQLLMSIDADLNSIKKSEAKIHLVSVDSDLFFPAFEIKNTFGALQNNQNIFYHEITSIHGHDAFLMEYEQLNTILKNII